MNNHDLKRFYQTLSGLDPLQDPENNPFYVPILQAQGEDDPISRLHQRIDWAASESVSLLTGFRGNGKSTELYRLKALLEKSDCRVIRLDMEDYLNTTQPLEIGDFLLSLMAAIADNLKDQAGIESLTESYWARLVHFLQSEVGLENLDFQIKGAGASAKLGFKLKHEPSFKQEVQEHLRGHLSRLVEQAREYVIEVVDTLRKQANNPDLKVVILTDSVEHIRGVGNDATRVYESIVSTFSGHADKLGFPALHIVYTVPPFLVLHANGAARTLGGHPIVMWPNIHVLKRQDGPNRMDDAGMTVMKTIIEKRFPLWEQAIPMNYLQSLATSSGGDLRDFFRLVREVLVRLGIVSRDAAETTLVDENMTKSAIADLRNELQLMLTEELKRLLASVHTNKQLNPENQANIALYTTALDANLIMNYQNGKPWFDAHPLIVDEIKATEPS